MASFRHYPQSVIIFITMLAGGLCAGAEPVPFAGGTGEPNDPYQIATAEQLVAIGEDANLLDKHFVLLNDIDLSPGRPGGRVFHEAVITADGPRPDATDPCFAGSLNGQGFKVLNLTIDARGLAAGSLALFGRIAASGRVHSLGIENVMIHADVSSVGVAGLVGINSGSVEACYASGSISGGSKVGGLCGENAGSGSGAIRSCYSMVSVSGDSQVGGLVGLYVGGPASRSSRVTGIINCYSSGVVQARELGGGLAGYEGGETLYSPRGNFWDIETSGMRISGTGTGLTTAQMMDAAIFASHGWDQDSNWVMEDGKDYPRLAWQKTSGRPIEGTLSDRFGGTGTLQDPYRIATAEQFVLIGIAPPLWDKHFALETDLDLTGFCLRPIGGPYRGFFHGNGHVLRGVSLEGVGKSRAGLFEYIDQAGRVSNLGLENVLVAVGPGSPAVGTLAGTNDGVITGCYASGLVTAEQSSSVGGLVGSNGGRVAYSYATVGVTGSDSPGGLVGGQSSSGLVLECYAARGVLAGDGSDSLVGANSGTVFNSYFLRRSDGPAMSPHGFALDDSQMRQRESFLGWDFADSLSDGPVDRWFMADVNYPILNWQADLQGLRPIPDIGGLSLEWAQAELELAGFTLGGLLHDYHSTIPKDYAIVTSPVGLAPPGSAIDLVLSQGKYVPRAADTWTVRPALIEMETPGQVECLAGVISGSWTFVLTRDIDMAGWEALPIKSPSAVFAGTFLGNGHTVSNLKVLRSGGFFAQVSVEGLVVGLGLENALVGGVEASSLGLLAARNDGIILACYATGAAAGNESTTNLGGLVGENRGIIAECFAAVTARGQQLESSGVEMDKAALPAHGGLVGWNTYTVADCYATGDVSGSGYVGGLVGDNYGPLSRCHATARVTSQRLENTGALVGRNGTIYNRSRTGGGSFPVPVTDCYFLGPAFGGGPDNGIGVALAALQMQQQASFVGWDFENIWMICEGRDYPRLRWEGVECDE